MHATLIELIERFRDAQGQGVAYIADVLGPAYGFRLPSSPVEWVRTCSDTGLYRVRQLAEVEIYAHGAGIELTFPNLTIDFDWGEFGEPDGFDVWRLWNFARSNPGEVPYPEYDEVKAWIDDASAAGELTEDRYLYYSPNHRASRPTRTD